MLHIRTKLSFYPCMICGVILLSFFTLSVHKHTSQKYYYREKIENRGRDRDKEEKRYRDRDESHFTYSRLKFSSSENGLDWTFILRILRKQQMLNRIWNNYSKFVTY